MSSIHVEPEIDIILPFHEVNEYLNQAIDSIFQSIGVRVRLILVDDRKDQFVEFNTPAKAILIKSGGIGYSKAILLGTQFLRSEYIGFLDSDDLTDPSRLKEQIELLKKSGADMCSCEMLKINSQNKVHRLQPVDLTYLTQQGYELLLGSFGANSTWVIKRKVLSNMIFFQSDVESLDWATSLKSFDQVKRTHLQKKYYFYRQHRGQMTKSPKYIESTIREIYPLWRNLNSRLGLPDLSRENFTSICLPNPQTLVDAEVIKWIESYQNKVTNLKFKKRILIKAVISYRVMTTIRKSRSWKNFRNGIKFDIAIGFLIYLSLILCKMPIFRVKVN